MPTTPIVATPPCSALAMASGTQHSAIPTSPSRLPTPLTPITVGVTVANTGDREGEEVVQLYVSDLVASVARPESYLIGFTRLSAAPGEAARVTFEVHPSRLAFYDESMQFVMEPGLFRFSVGASSSDIRQAAVVDITGPVATYSQRSVVAVTARARGTGRTPLKPRSLETLALRHSQQRSTFRGPVRRGWPAPAPPSA